MANKKESLILKWVPVASILVSCVVVLLGWTVWIARNVAQTSYVDEISTKQLKYIDVKIAETQKYTDDRVIALRQESFDHSDKNRANMESEYKSLGAKLDMLIMIVQANQVQQQVRNIRK